MLVSGPIGTRVTSPSPLMTVSTMKSTARRAADRIAEHGSDAEHLDLAAHERERQCQRVVDVVPDVGVQDDLVHGEQVQ